MTEIQVFDPAQCCATGVCGADVDAVLVTFAADLEWLSAQGVPVRRFNLAQEAAAFAHNPLVRRTLQSEGTECLPLVVRRGEIVSRGRYPARTELADWGGVAMHARLAPEGVHNAATPAGAESAGNDCCAPALLTLGNSQRQDRGTSGCC